MQRVQSILLFGASAFMASVEAVLKAHPGLSIRRMPFYSGLTGQVDAILVDSSLESCQIYQLVKENMGIPIFLLEGGKAHLTALISKEYDISNSADLADILREFL